MESSLCRLLVEQRFRSVAAVTSLTGERGGRMQGPGHEIVRREGRLRLFFLPLLPLAGGEGRVRWVVKFAAALPDRAPSSSSG
jgi:hypothetical protein